MTEIELVLPASARAARVSRVVEQAAAAAGLTPALKGTLARYPGCVHWHFRKRGTSGTLEITWWPRGRRLWIKVAGNRRGAWMDTVIPRLQRSIESDL